MSKDIRLETAAEFLKWANRQSSGNRFKLDDRYSHNHKTGKGETTYLLEVCGTGGTFHGNNHVYIPNDIGIPLSLEWKKSEWNRFIGMWGIKKILNFLYGQDVAEDWKAIQKEIEAKDAIRMRRIAADNARIVLDRISEDLVKLDGYLERAELKGMITGDVTCPGLDDVRYVVKGFLEVTNV